MRNIEKENSKKQVNLAKIFKKIISVGLVTLILIIVSSCNETPSVEEREIGSLVEGQATFKTSPEVNQEEETTDEPEEEETEETQIEFNDSMIKNRLTFTEHVVPQEPWIVPKAPVPLWYVQEWGNSYENMVSGVIAGPLEKGIGATDEEELLLPVAFQNPKTGEFYVLNISFGADEHIQAQNDLGGFPVVFLDNYIYTLAGSYEGYTATIEVFEKIKENFKEGDQIAFTFIPEWDTQEWGPFPSEETIEDNRLKILYTLINSYFQNNKTIYEAMKENKDLPELSIFPHMIIVNKTEK